MKIISLHASINTIILVSMVLLDALYNTTELGGVGSLFNVAIFLLAVGFIFLNAQFNRFLMLAFIVPLLGLVISCIINGDELVGSGVHTALSIAAGYFLLMLSPPLLNYSLMKRLVLFYLLGFLMLSMGHYLEQLLNGNTVYLMANSNFSGNPNAASLSFFGCLLLSFVFTRRWLRWVFMIASFVLILTTASRAGVCTGFGLLIGFVCVGGTNEGLVNRRLLLSKNVGQRFLMMLIIAGFIYFLFPESFSYLQRRLLGVGFDLSSGDAGLGRDLIWQQALELGFDSVQVLLFGAGFGHVINNMKVGMHSSYVLMIVSVGWIFMISTLCAIGCLFNYHKKKSQYEFIFFACLILIYGAFEDILFNGMNSLWMLFIFLSLYYRSLESRAVHSSKLNKEAALSIN